MAKTIPSQSSTVKPSEKRKREASPERPFPRATLEDSVKIPLAIRQKNGGNPWDPTSIATFLETGKGNPFFYLTAASRDFGLTVGTRDTAEISLTELGRRLAFAETPRRREVNSTGSVSKC